MYWSDASLIIDLVDKYVKNLQKNVTHISSVEIHVGIVDMHIFFPCPCHILFDIYDDHVALQIFDISQTYDKTFETNFVSE